MKDTTMRDCSILYNIISKSYMSHQMIAIFPAPNGRVDDYTDTDRPHNSQAYLPKLITNSNYHNITEYVI